MYNVVWYEQLIEEHNHLSLPSRSASSSTNSYAGLNFSDVPFAWLEAFKAGLGCVSVVPPRDV